MPCARFLVFLTALVLALPAPAQEAPPPGPPGIAWRPDYDLALKEARERGLPIMVAFVIRGEPANDTVIRHHFKDARTIELSRRFVCLVACLGLTEAEDAVRWDGTRGTVSTDLGSVSPAEIDRVEMRARMALMNSPKVSCPQFVFLASDGETPLLRHVWMLSASELQKKMELALAYFDPASAPPGFRDHRDTVTRLLAEADDNNQDKRRTALGTLATLDDPRIIDFLVKQTGPQADGQKRLEAILLMGVKGNAKALTTLHGLLAFRDTQVRTFTAVALAGIAMQESSSFLLAALKRETQDRVRSHMLRALAACDPDPKELEEALLTVLRRSSQLDQVTCLYLLSGLPVTPAVTKAFLKAMAASNSKIRTAAYYGIGTLKLMEAKPGLKMRASSERGETRDACLWALAQLGEEPYEGESDPAILVRDMLPENYLYDGEFEDPAGDQGRRPPGGRPGGGGRRGR